MNKKNGAERRQHERHELKDRVFITVRPQFERMGWLTDISRGGVSFEYTIIQNYSPLTNNIEVDIFSSPNVFNLSNLPCQLVYDTPINNHSKSFINTFESRRCGLAFDQMSPHHLSQIDIILKNYTNSTPKSTHSDCSFPDTRLLEKDKPTHPVDNWSQHL